MNHAATDSPRLDGKALQRACMRLLVVVVVLLFVAGVPGSRKAPAAAGATQPDRDASSATRSADAAAATGAHVQPAAARDEADSAPGPHPLLPH